MMIMVHYKIWTNLYYQNDEMGVFWNIPEYSGYKSKSVNGLCYPETEKVQAFFWPWNYFSIIHFFSRQKTENDTDSWYVCFLEYNPGEHEVEILKHWAESKNGQTYSCLVKRRTFIIDRMVGYSKSLVGKLTLLGLPKEEIWVGRAGRFSLILP